VGKMGSVGIRSSPFEGVLGDEVSWAVALVAASAQE
jgi:hypothetical protein